MAGIGVGILPQEGTVDGDEIDPLLKLCQKIHALVGNAARIGEVQNALPAPFDEPQERFARRVMSGETVCLPVAEGNLLERTHRVKCDRGGDFLLHLPPRAFGEHLAHLGISEDGEVRRGHFVRIFVAVQDKIMRIEVIHMRVRDEQIPDRREIGAEARHVEKGVGREVDGEFAVQEDLCARAHFVAALAARYARTQAAAIFAVAEQRGDSFRRARPEILYFHIS